MSLTERKREILREITIRFIRNAEPVSSQCVAACPDFQLSPATIRKEMAELEDMGYLTHPHTSSGRVPSDKGYKFFVESFIKNKKMIGSSDTTDTPKITLKVSKDMEIESILAQSSKQLAEITNYLSLIIAPAISQSSFRHLEILRFDGGNMMLVLITDTGRVFKRQFVVEGSYNNLDFQSVSNILNIALKGKNITSIDYKDIRVTESDSHLIPLIKKIIGIISVCAQEALVYNRLYIHGAASVLNQPDFYDIRKMQSILNVIENEYLLMNLLSDFEDNEDFIVKIGSEIFEDGPDDLSLVASKYKIYENSTGAVGILGPKRMDYYKVIGIINKFVENLMEVFSTRT